MLKMRFNQPSFMVGFYNFLIKNTQKMLSYFNNSQNDKFVLASASDIGLYQLDGGNRAEELVLEDSKPQNLSKFQIIKNF